VEREESEVGDGRAAMKAGVAAAAAT